MRYFAIRSILLGGMAFLLSLQVFGQSDLQKGRQFFFENNRTEATSSLKRALNQPSEKAEAHLLLSLIYGTEDKDLDAFRQFKQFFEHSSNPYPYLFALWNNESVSGSGSKKTPEELAFFEQLLIDPKANGTLKAMTAGVLGDHFEEKNQFPKAQTYFSKIGSIEPWAFAGEFENISESGFDKVFDPISKPEESAEFINKNGAKVNWFTMKGNRCDKWVDLTYHFFTDNSIIFSQTFVQSPVDQEVYIRIGTSGSLKAWVNDGLVYTEPEERNNDLDTYVTKVQLNKGFNRILVQIGASEINRSNFMLRLTNQNGDPLPDLQVVPTFQSYNKSTLALPKPIRNFSEVYFTNLVNENPKDVLPYLMLASAHLKSDKGPDARRVLTKGLPLAPNCSFLKVQLLNAYSNMGNEVDAKITIEWLKQNDPNNIACLNIFFDEEMEKERYEAAAAILDTRDKLYGEDENSILKRISLAAKGDEQNVVIKLVEKGYTKYPNDFRFVELKKNVAQSVTKSAKTALEVVRKFLKTNYSYEAQKMSSDILLGMDRISEGVKAFQTIIDNSPNVASYHYNLGKFYSSARTYNLAEKCFQNAIDLGPNIYYFRSGLGLVYLTQGKDAKAKECYQKALELNPRDFESREQLRKLTKKPEIFSYFSAPDVYDIVKKAPDSKAYPNDNCLVLLDEVQKVVYAGGVSEEKRIFVAKILKSDGIDRWKQYYISHFPMQDFTIEKNEVIKANGSRVEGSINRDEIVFSSLEIGDAIHVTYRLKSYNVGKLASHFWETCYFQYFTPYQTTRYNLLIDKGIPFNYTFSKENIVPTIETKDEFQKYTWEKLNEPALSFEDKMPNLVDVGNLMYLSSIPDWTFVSNWYHDLAAAKSKVNLDVQETTDKLFEGKTDLNDLQKAKLIYEYITENIKYLSVSFLQSGLIPQKASHVINSRLGDCKDVSTLFVAMCKAVGVKANLVLIATRDAGKNQLLLPTIEFNHCIARLDAEGKEYYIELTSDKLPFNTFYDNLKNASALLIFDEASGKKSELFHLNPTTRNLNLVIRNSEMRFEENNILIKKNNLKTGVFASNMRNSFRDLGSQEQMKDMQKAISGDYNQTILTSLNFQNLDGVSDSVTYTYAFKAPESINEIGGMQIVALPWSEKSKSSDFNFSENREFPIDLWEMEVDQEEEDILIYLPPKMVLAEMPAKVSLRCPSAEYSQDFSLKGNVVKAKRKFRYLKDQVNTDELKDFEVFYRKMVAADNRQIAMKKSTKKLPEKAKK